MVWRRLVWIILSLTGCFPIPANCRPLSGLRLTRRGPGRYLSFIILPIFDLSFPQQERSSHLEISSYATVLLEPVMVNRVDFFRFICWLSVGTFHSLVINRYIVPDITQYFPSLFKFFLSRSVSILLPESSR